MPSSIPYDPSLVLGNLVHPERIKVIEQIAAAQAVIDAAEDQLNSYLAMMRSIDMTIAELNGLGIDTKTLADQKKAVGKNIQDSAIKYMKEVVDGQKKIQPQKAKIGMVHDEYESPIDYNKTDLKKMPLSADSLKMNAQYFSHDENKQTGDTQATTISAFVAEQTDEFGDSFSAQAKVAAQKQVSSQYARHSIQGTLVISIACTHKDAVVLAPFILDVDKALRVWNQVQVDQKQTDQMIKTDDLNNLGKIAAKADTPDDYKYALKLLSGATYGSCFIGMVHVLNTTETMSNEEMSSVASSLQAQFKVGAFFADESGGFGVDSSFSNDAKNLLSTQNVSSHCTLITMGSIPSIKSNQVALGVKAFTDDDGAKSMAALAKLQNATADDFKTMDSAADSARTGGQFVALQTAKVNAVLSGLSEIDDKANKVLDINSMMDAMEDYVNKCLSGNVGVPINYYIKSITRSQIAQMWMAKYYPEKYLSISGDDSAVLNPSGGGGGKQPVNGK
jgi:hypothetical protein